MVTFWWVLVVCGCSLASESRVRSIEELEEDRKQESKEKMARRRRRMKRLAKSLLLLQMLLLNLLVGSTSAHQSRHIKHQNQIEEEQLGAFGANTAHLCSLLPNYVTRHLKLCKLMNESGGAQEAVSVGATRALQECKSQFRADRWNCSHSEGDQHLLTGELSQAMGTREYGFVQAIAAAGIVHSVAVACSVGNLTDCSCDKTRVGLTRVLSRSSSDEENWNFKWGGCSHNIKHGMTFAKHLVELLDVWHQLHHNKRFFHRRRLKRSLSSRHREPNQVRLNNRTTTSQQLDETNFPFCQTNSNLSNETHLELIKSLLAKNSLEKHQEFRLAMNMHNNKVGRMAVAKNMELRCRCHGLSGSCSLKTCWLTLPNFQVIGAYLRKKYEASILLPSAVNVNKLIPMMDRTEIGTILSSQQQSIASGSASGSGEQRAPEPAPAPEFAALVMPRAQLSGHFIAPPANTPPPHFGYYERHKLQLQGRAHQSGREEDLPANVSVLPMSQQQYQSLVRDMKLCNNSQLATRELKQAKTKTMIVQQHQVNGQHLKSANQQLSQVLHSNKDELIHLHKSPDYCEADARHGFAGIESRQCSDNPAAPDHCDKLCCGRGFIERVIHQSFKCDCKFQYCCSIWCSVCEKEIKLLVCR